MKRRILGQRWESLKMFQNITPHFCDRTRWTRCAQIVSRYFAALSKCERRKNSLTSAFVLLWKERMRSGGLKYASPLKKGKSHAIWVLSETLSPPIEKFFAEDLQLLRPPALLRTTNKPQNSRRLERAITRIYKFGKISRIFIGLLLFHIGKVGTFCGALILILILFCGALILRISRQILGQADRVLLQRGVGRKIRKIGTD